MAPSSALSSHHLHLLPRQFGRPGDNENDISRTAILGIVIGTAILIIVISIVIWTRVMRRRRAWRRAGNQSSVPLHTRGGAGPGGSTSSASSATAHSRSNLLPLPYSSKPPGSGYESSPDQNQGLLAHAALPGTVPWGHQGAHPDPVGPGVGSTQDGFGFTTANITRPASVVNFDVPPPRYEEAAGLSVSDPSLSTTMTSTARR